jgi:hypothetical protein
MKELAAIVGGSIGSLFVVWVLLMMLISAAAPVIVFVVLRNISRTRAALERIADALETRGVEADASEVLGLSRIRTAARTRESA